MVKIDNIFFMFCGQGSQYAGMGEDFFKKSTIFKEYLEIASDHIDRDLYGIVFDKQGQGKLLNDTKYSQLSIYCLGSALARYIKENTGISASDIKAVIGHSLGDYGGLTFSGNIDFDEGVKLVAKRGELMSRENESSQGMMAAVVGVDISRLTDMINESGKKVYIANHNDHKQIVISGIKDDVMQLISFLKEKGIRRVIPLKVNIASHCPLMEEVSERLYKYIDKNIDFKDSETAFYSSTELKFLDKEDIPICLKKQLTSPIRWVDSIENLADENSMFIEIGPGNILSRIVKNIVKKADYKDIEVLNTDSYEQIEHVINYIKEVI